MAEKFINERDLRFLLYEVFDIESLTAHAYFSQHNRKVFDMVLDATVKLAKKLCHPVLQEMDLHPPELKDGQVKVHSSVRKFIQECGQGGWIAAGFPYETEGEQMPHMINSICRYIFSAANYSISVYPFLTAGAAELITTFGEKGLVDTYVSQMLSGQWQGTMALTEPQAGSSLADITTEAQPTQAGYYHISGQKIFISAGDHDGVDNVVHLLLARIEGAPAGVKGISLFVVPKLRPRADGRLVPNDVTTSQVYHKLGYRGCPITELSFGQKGDCRGYLVGEANRGLSYMFQMMNGARIEVGLGAAAIAQAAYCAALEYAKLRPQGRPLGQKDPARPQVPIIEHADVKRMLFFQRSVVEGALSLIVQCARYADMKHVAKGEDGRRYALLLDLLTPVAKTYPSENGIWAVSSSLQCLGGYGYCEDFPLGQFYRDIRIHPIHEGTTGIQGMDLLGRKVIMENGRALKFFSEEVRKTIKAAGELSALAILAAQLEAALNRLLEVTAELVSRAVKSGADVFLADATIYLELFGITTVAWQWLMQAIAAYTGIEKESSKGDIHFYQGKLTACRYFFKYELPKTGGMAETLLDAQPLTVEASAQDF